MYPNDETTRKHLIELLHNIAPGFELEDYHAEPMHDHLQVQVRARQGMNRLMFDARVYPMFATQGRFNYIGTAGQGHLMNMSPYAKVLIDAYPDAHVQHYDNEEDGHSAQFGYVAYDDDFRPIAWSPMPLGEDGDEDVEGPPPAIAHTLPDLTECMGYIRSEERRRQLGGI